jgi:hypothetical protein
MEVTEASPRMGHLRMDLVCFYGQKEKTLVVFQPKTFSVCLFMIRIMPRFIEQFLKMSYFKNVLAEDIFFRHRPFKYVILYKQLSLRNNKKNFNCEMFIFMSSKFKSNFVFWEKLSRPVRN